MKVKIIIIINLLRSKIKLVYICTLCDKYFVLFKVIIKYVNYKNMDISHSHIMIL